jgi:hypothetical protein
VGSEDERENDPEIAPEEWVRKDERENNPVREIDRQIQSRNRT